MVYGLIESSNLGLGHPVVLSTLAVGVVTLIAFIFVEAHSRAPMMPLSVSFADFQRGKLADVPIVRRLFFPFNLIQVQVLSYAAGAAFLPLILIMFLLALVRRLGQPLRCSLMVGPTIAYWIRSVCSATNWRQLLDDFSSSDSARFRWRLASRR